MLIMIDAYNLLKQQDSGAFIQDSAKHNLVNMLSAYKKLKGHSILLIFDGGASLRPSQEIQKNIIVVYAGQGKSADDYIKFYLAEHPKQDILLVSSDRELALWASTYGIASMDALPFYAFVQDSLHAAKKVAKPVGLTYKTTHRENPVLDMLMYDAVPEVSSKEGIGAKPREKLKKEKESKIDRLLRKKVEKL
jgi:predicted RNA-binding protein with PIN domain